MNAIKSVISKNFIAASEFVKLISFTDDKRLIFEMKDKLNGVKRGLILSILSYFIAFSLLGALLLDVGYKNLSHSSLSMLFLLYLFFILVGSYLENALCYLNASYIAEGLLHNWFGQVTSYLSESEAKILNEFTSTISYYHLYVSYIILETLRLLIVVFTLIFSKALFDVKAFTLLVVIVTTLLMVLGGKGWYRIKKQVYEKNKRLESVNGSLLRYRVLFPTISNSVTHLMPFLVAILVWFNINSVVAQIGLFSSVVVFFFGLTNNITSISVSKTSIVKLNTILEKLTLRYVINQTGFTKLADQCYPSTALVATTAKDKSFVVKSFVPMAISNLKEITHIYNFEFLPGVYQLQGINGVGKTTFLEALTLPENVLVEYSKGEVAFQGKAFFDSKLTIAEHRQKYVYIGTNASQVTASNLQSDLFSTYPNIKRFIEAFIQDSKVIQSEGEKAVLSICMAYTKVRANAVSLVFIDEAISRIYNDETYPLRQEIIELIKEMSQLDSLIVIVVDHMTRLPFAKQLHFEKKSIAA